MLWTVEIFVGRNSLISLMARKKKYVLWRELQTTGKEG